MIQFLVAVGLAALGGLTVLAYKNPDGYKGLAKLLIFPLLWVVGLMLPVTIFFLVNSDVTSIETYLSTYRSLDGVVEGASVEQIPKEQLRLVPPLVDRIQQYLTYAFWGYIIYLPLLFYSRLLYYLPHIVGRRHLSSD